MSLHADLHTVQMKYRGMTPWPGLFRALGHASIAVAFNVAIFLMPLGWSWWAIAVMGGFVSASLLVLTHDGLHYTLTGWRGFDDLFSRLVSYPILWPHCTYAELHRLHHKYNGNDLRDPERVMASANEMAGAGPWKRFYRRYQWPIKLFVVGGLGLILHHWFEAFHLRKSHPALNRAMRNDFLGTTAWYGVAFFALGQAGLLGRWGLVFIVMERIIGFVHQLRSQVEHYGAWSHRNDPLETQVFSSRNTRAPWIISQFYNGLNFHSVHHAFPAIPFYKLHDVHVDLDAICHAHNQPLLYGEGYLSTARKQFLRPTYIP